ncbi:prepilin-type N-terminal cleavage/methylation domain-containing protein [Bradyrhizobium sp. SZCCHNRI1003]|uniref:prepilin-type N-terminal cleavage/methylation domain-containing protein n=1 Tax=Bradyrhizobium sp. SZCCHNRI1003 TaxID=3057275 RepID=UPI002916A612|nr:prepilin-type N-terminal cleavage/methylation domain-containing protein [Bradyrhizobium sp. SZCCHNRI1003]
MIILRLPVRRQAEHGFTLIEVLAALAIGAAVIAGVAALIHNVALNFDRGTGLAGKADQLLLAAERIGADLGSARQLPRGRDAKAGVAFVGEPGQLRFIAAGGVAAGPQGEEVVSLTVEDVEGTAHLIRRRAPWSGPRTLFESLALRDPIDLIEGNVDIAFAFGSFGADGNLIWSDSWRSQRLLPRLVRLTIRDRASGAELLPGLAFRLRSDAPLGCAQADASADCLKAGAPAQAAPKQDRPRTEPAGARG